MFSRQVFIELMEAFITMSPDPVAKMLGTGYSRFVSQSGIDGLCKIDGDTLCILAVHATKPNSGQFRDFVSKSKAQFPTIKIYEVWNPDLESALDRYGFRKLRERVFCAGESEMVDCYRWDK